MENQFKAGKDFIFPTASRISTWSDDKQNFLSEYISKDKVNNLIVNQIYFADGKTLVAFPVHHGYKYIIRHAPCNSDENNVSTTDGTGSYCIQEIKQLY